MISTIVIVGNFFDDDTRIERSISSDSPAASRKMLMMAEAIQTTGNKACLLSYGRGASRCHRKYFDSKNISINDVSISYLPFLSSGALSKIFSSFLMAVNVFFLGLRNRPIFVFYNRYYGHIPALIIAKLIGFKVILDLEDENPTNTLGSKIYSKFFDFFCNAAILACAAMKARVNINSKYLYYGVAQPVNVKSKFFDKKINVLASGTFDQNAGSLVLYDAIKIIQSNPGVSEKFHFHLIGYGDEYAQFGSLASDNFLSLYGRVTQSEYSKIIELCDVGLSLKLPSGLYSNTTFPSKVIEYVSHGLLLVSYDISDVKALLNDNAVYLKWESPSALIDNLMMVASDRVTYAKIAMQGQKAISSCMNHASSGADLIRFIKGSH